MCVKDFTELIVSHQTYGCYPKPHTKASAMEAWKTDRGHLDLLFEKYKDHSMVLVYDYHRPPPIKARAPDGNQDTDFDYHWMHVCQPFWAADEEEMRRFWEAKGSQAAPHWRLIQHATCFKRMVDTHSRRFLISPSLHHALHRAETHRGTQRHTEAHGDTRRHIQTDTHTRHPRTHMYRWMVC